MTPRDRAQKHHGHPEIFEGGLDQEQATRFKIIWTRRAAVISPPGSYSGVSDIQIMTPATPYGVMIVGNARGEMAWLRSGA
jgi:hypothetical protein